MVEACGEWQVHVVEDGQEKSLSFDLRAFAVAFAEGQRIRLHLDKIVRL
ncbi:hypothetical protein X740_31785 [Mesorhizobium sp. LNHC221B00]|nr:hypothetical protein X740_31785 [Mesorhizobium sp. LNHC221B00]